MFEIGRDRKKPLDFLPAQDLGQSLRRFGTRETKLRLTLLERDAIEKPQAVGNEVTGAMGEPPLPQEV